MLKRINDVLPELVAEILAYGLIAWLLGVWFVEDKLRYSIGLWIGIAAAIGMAVHMAIVILDSVDLAIEKKAKVRTTLFAMLRYVVVAVLFVIVAYFRLGSVIAMFIGIMGLKVAAYLQPFVHKLRMKRDRRSDDKGNNLYQETDKSAEM